MRMIPLKFTRRNAGEEKVFLRLSESFIGKKYTALHSIYLAEHIRQHCGEIDFILITNLAIVVLEVKATIRFNPTTGIWNYGSYENDKSPLQQAEDNMQSLRKFLMNENQFLTKKFPFVSLVVVTEDRWLEDQKNIQIENNKIIDKHKLSYLEETILSSIKKEREKLFDKYKIKFDKSISHNDVESMIKLILPNIALQSPEISDSSADLLLVEKNQRIYLDNMLYTSNDKNVILSGNAGTGKTFLLKELIKSIKKNQSILFICFSKLLLNDISLFSESNNNVTCFRYYDLAKLLIQKAQLKINTNGISEEKIFKEIFPEKMQGAIINLIDKNLQTFDWILVDEAQDLFSKPIIDSLSMLKNKNLGKLILALDVGLQSEVFKNFDKAYYDEAIKDSEVIKLYSNFRNPKNIAMKAVEVCGINNIEDFKRAFDSPIRFKFIEKNIIYELKELLLELIDEENIKPKNITILTPKISKKSILSDIDRIGKFALVDLKNLKKDKLKGHNKVSWSTVASYKGLENDIIILIEFDKFTEDLNNSILYTAMTRVKTKFIHLGEKENVVFRKIHR